MRRPSALPTGGVKQHTGVTNGQTLPAVHSLRVLLREIHGIQLVPLVGPLVAPLADE